MDEDKSIRVVVKINPSRHPELHEALNEIESSGRAERLRSLALMALSGYSAAQNDGGSPDGGGRKKGRTKPAPEAEGKAEEQSAATDSPKAINDEEPAVPEKPEPEPKEEDDPHAEVRKSVLKGMKNVGF